MTGYRKSSTPEYIAWSAARSRCNNPNNENYPRYGGRGIKMCERWFNSFETFLTDMGSRPSPEHSLDRRDNDGNYEPGNCHWVTLLEQARNRSNNTHVIHGEQHKTISQLSEESGLSHARISQRMRLQGDSPERALRPIREIPQYEYKGQTLTLREWSSTSPIKYKTLHRRVVGMGWSIEKALTTPVK